MEQLEISTSENRIREEKENNEETHILGLKVEHTTYYDVCSQYFDGYVQYKIMQTIKINKSFPSHSRTSKYASPSTMVKLGCRRTSWPSARFGFKANPSGCLSNAWRPRPPSPAKPTPPVPAMVTKALRLASSMPQSSQSQFLKAWSPEVELSERSWPLKLPQSCVTYSSYLWF